MVKGKGGALFALGLAGLAYLFKNRGQVRESLGKFTNRADRTFQQPSEPVQGQSSTIGTDQTKTVNI